MPIAAETPEEVVVLPHKLWTRDECVALERSGLLGMERYELIEGELVPQMAKNPPHTRALRLLILWLQTVFGGDFVLQEASIDLRPEDQPTSEPEPDALALTLSFLDLEPGERPGPDQLRLVVKVSSSTLSVDRTTKARLYARSGIVEYWILDVEGRRIIMHRNPIDGAYRSIEIYSEHESVSTLAALDRTIRVADFLK